MNRSSEILSEAAKRDTEIESGQVAPLTESEFWASTQGITSLDEAESQRFVDALLAAPGKPTQRFNRALNIYQGSVAER